MWLLIAYLIAPLALAPLIAYASRHLFALFIREAAELFAGLEMHKPWAITLGTDVAVVNIIIFALAWWVAVGLNVLALSALIVMLPFLFALALAIVVTRSMVKSRLRLASGDAWLVGLLSFAGGNLPLIILIPLLLFMVLSQKMAVFGEIWTE